jgi:DNA-binding response OmpR family regulator
MIMLVTYRPELREQLNQTLQAKGHETCIPKHRQDVMVVIKDCHPHLIILDMYLSEPSGVDVLKTIRHCGYHGRVLVLSGQSMTSVLHDAYPIGVDKVVQVPEKVAGHFDFGELELAIDMCLKCNLQHERAHYQAVIAKRAHELYEGGGRQDGRDIHDWLRAEQELAS